MLPDLIRYDLEYEKTYEYVLTVLNSGKSLSAQFIKAINFKEGQFFSLLTKEADLERLYEFSCGRLYPVGPLKEVVDKERIYEWYTDGMYDEFIYYLYTCISDLKFNCLFEDILSYPTDPNEKHQRFFNKYGLSHNQEVYYLVKTSDVLNELLEESLWRSNSHDHSLCVLTNSKFDDVKDKTLTLEKIEEICRETKIMIIGAYDGEGYVFWENKS